MRILFSFLFLTLVLGCQSRRPMSTPSGQLDSELKASLSTLPGVDASNLDTLIAKLNRLGVQPVQWEPGYNYQMMDSALGVIEDVQKTVTWGSTPMFPNSLKVKFFRELDNGGSYVANRMEIGNQVRHSDQEVLSPEVSRFAIAHEYGHSIFDVLMSQQNSIYREHFINKVKYYDLRDRIEELSRTNPTDPQIDSLIAHSKHLLDERSEEAKNIYRLFLPYNELFADVVGVLYARNGKAMVRVGGEDRGVRDFTKDLSSTHWNRTDDYGMLAPTRSKMGRVFGLGKGSAENPGKLLRAIVRAIDREYKEELSTSGYQVDKSNVAKANAKILQLIEEEYKKAGTTCLIYSAIR